MILGRWPYMLARQLHFTSPVIHETPSPAGIDGSSTPRYLNIIQKRRR